MEPSNLLRSVKDLKPGDHLCFLYDNEEQHRALLTPFLRQGLERGERVVYIIDAHTAEDILSYLQDDGLEVQQLLANGQLKIIPTDQIYTPDGAFDPERTIALLVTETEHALADGYSALRVTGEESWALNGCPGSHRLIDYESRVNALFNGSNCLALCQYDRRRFDPAMLLDVLAMHPIVAVGTSLYENCNYISLNGSQEKDRAAATLQRWTENLAAHKRAVDHYDLRLEFQKTISSISSRFVGVFDIDDAINASLADIGRLSGAGRSYLFLFRQNGALMENTHEWCAEGVSPQIENLKALPSEVFPWWVSKLRNGETIHITEVSRLPSEAKAEKEILESQDIKSILVIPVRIGAELGGFIGFDNIVAAGEWSEDDLTILRTASEIIGRALQHDRMEKEREGLLKQLDVERRRLEAVLQQMPAGVVIAEAPSGRFILENEQVRRLWRHERTPSAWIEEYAQYAGFHPDGQPYKAEEWPLARSIRHGEVVVGEEIGILRGDGTHATILANSAPMFDSQGNVVAGIVTFYDLTDRKQVEEELRASENKYRTLIENVPHEVFIKNKESVYISCNGKFAEQHGLTPDEVVGKSDYDFHRKELADRFIADDRRIFETGKTEEIEEKYVQGGRELVVNAVKTPVKDEKGNIVGLLGILWDVTDRKRIQEALRQSEERYRTLAESAQDTIFIIDSNICVQYINSYGAGQLGCQPEEIIGKKLEELSPSGTFERLTRTVKRVLRKGEPLTAERKLMLPSGEAWLHTRLVPLKNEKGETTAILGMSRDITEHGRLLDQLEIERARLETVLQQMPAGVIIVEAPSGKVILANNEVDRIWRYTRDLLTSIEQYGKYQYFHSDGRPYTLDERPLVRSLRRGEVVEGEEVEFVRGDGTRGVMSISSAPLRNREGNIIMAVLACHDITERKQMEMATRESEQRFRAITQAVPLPMAITSMSDEKILYANDHLASAFGVPLEKLIGRRMPDLYYNPSQRRLVLDALKRDGYVRNHEVLHKRADGTPFWLDLSLETITFEGVLATIGAGYDVTERKRAEDLLQTQFEQFSTVVDSMNALVYVADMETHELLFLNPYGAKLFGADAVGKPCYEVLQVGQVGKCPFCTNDRLLRDSEPQPPYVWEFQNTVTQRWFQCIDRAIRWTDGRLVRMEVAVDITERRRAEEEIRRLNEDLQHRAAELDNINKELEAFTYSVSHDLRAPLRSIDGFSKALMEDYPDSFDTQGQDYINRVRAASQHMAQLIDDLLMLSRVSRGELRRDKVDLSALAEDCARELKSAQRERKVEFIIASGLAAKGDSRLLRVVMQNLLGNAWKFTGKHPQAKIEFGVTNHEGKQAYFVRDDGAGFDMAYAEKLFGAFQRLHGSKEFPGTGIGLATVKRIINRHGGQVWAEGGVEKGATFYFTL